MTGNALAISDLFWDLGASLVTRWTTFEDVCKALEPGAGGLGGLAAVMVTGSSVPGKTRLPGACLGRIFFDPSLLTVRESAYIGATSLRSASSAISAAAS